MSVVAQDGDAKNATDCVRPTLLTVTYSMLESASVGTLE
jgi:hypothetical protein